MDGAIAVITGGRCPDLEDGRRLAQRVRRLALALFPGQEDTFDLIYRPRLERALRERFDWH